MRLTNKELAFCEELREAEATASQRLWLKAAQMREEWLWRTMPRKVMAVPRNKRVLLEDYPEPTKR